MTDAYRSYVIRIRRRVEAPTAVRLELEDLLGGGRAALSGRDAERLADRLGAILHPPAEPPADADPTGPEDD